MGPNLYHTSIWDSDCKNCFQVRVFFHGCSDSIKRARGSNPRQSWIHGLLHVVSASLLLRQEE